MDLKRMFMIVGAAGALAVAGCGDDEDTDTGTTGAATTAAEPEASAPAPASGTLQVAADPGGDLAYTETELTATTGAVKVVFTNDSTTPHDFVVEREDDDVGRTEIVTKGKAEATIELEPGSYTFYCSVGSHRQAGMEGTLEVE